MVNTAILEKLEALSTPQQIEVLHYIEFLLERYGEPPVESIQQSEAFPAEESGEKNGSQKKRGGLGVLKGKIWMSNDFDESLEELKAYM